MKKLLYLVSILFCNVLFASETTELGPIASKVKQLQNSKINFESVLFLTKTQISDSDAEKVARTTRNATFLNFNATSASTFLKTAPQYLKMSLPINNVEKEVLLYEAEIFAPDFSVVTSESNGEAVEYTGGKHYRGVINGDDNSLVAISFFENEIMGLVATNEGNYVIGKLDNNDQSTHIIYNDKDMNITPENECATIDDNESAPDPHDNNMMEKTVKCVRFYWEVNYSIYQNKGSVLNATNYVTGLFNQSAIIYTNDGISTTLSEVFVWSSVSPYTSNTTSGLLSQFQSNRNSFNGDLGHLLGYAGGGGVAAGFSGLCASNLDNSMCYSAINSTYNNVPTYSWSVNVVAHEQGHLLGSRHTHACVWNGNNTAIDNCGPSQGYGYEGSCSNAPTPVGGGTIMSYCHLTNGGINFNQGFGTQPKNLIVNNIESKACLTSCGGSGCIDALEPNNTFETAASISVNTNLAAEIVDATDIDFYSFTLSSISDLNISLSNLPEDYDMSLYNSSGTIIASSTNGGTTNESILLGNAAIGTYKLEILGIGGVSSSTICYSLFAGSTISLCTDNYESNNTTQTAKLIGANGSINGVISSATDIDWFKFKNTTAARNIKVTLSNLPEDYDMAFYKGNTLLGESVNGGTIDEVIVYNTTVVSTYKVRITGFSGVFNSSCYSLTTQISSGTFAPGLNNISIEEQASDFNEFSVFPNPANNALQFNIPANEFETTTINIIDKIGRVVENFEQSSSNVNNIILLNVQHFASGMYFIQMVQGDQSTLTKQVISH
jgi:Metallo-peptidase family M12/Secretion system C-terminal sorting domain/Reprolysin family propeptide